MSQGQTSVLTTAVCPKTSPTHPHSDKISIPSFVPLTVDYRQKCSAGAYVRVLELVAFVFRLARRVIVLRPTVGKISPNSPSTFHLSPFGPSDTLYFWRYFGTKSEFILIKIIIIIRRPEYSLPFVKPGDRYLRY